MIYLVIHVTNAEYFPSAYRNFEDAFEAYNRLRKDYGTIYETVEEGGPHYFTTDVPGEFVILIKTELF